MNLTRREMLSLSAGAVASCAVAGRAANLFAAEKQLPIGLQMWSVRQLCDKDLPGVLAAVGKMGYDGVELAHSEYGHDAASWSKLLKDNGLAVCGMHTSLPKLQGDEYQKTLDFQLGIGNKRVILASLPKKAMESMEGLLDACKQLNELAAKLGEHGIEVGYHCHAGDFEKVNGTAPWGVIGKNTKPEVIMQIDTANASQGGADPVAWIKEFPGRSKTVHLKDHGGETAVIGTGNVDFKAVIRASRQVGGAEWFIIEEESKDPAGALERVAQSLENLRKILKGM